MENIEEKADQQGSGYEGDRAASDLRSPAGLRGSAPPSVARPPRKLGTFGIITSVHYLSDNEKSTISWQNLNRFIDEQSNILKG